MDLRRVQGYTYSTPIQVGFHVIFLNDTPASSSSSFGFATFFPVIFLLLYERNG